MSVPLLLPTFTARFASIIGNMRYERATGTPSDRRVIPLLGPILNHRNRLCRQFVTIVARAEAGTLRASPRRGARKARVQRFTWPRPPRMLPTGKLWIAKLAPWMGRGQEIYVLVMGDAEMAALIEAAPQVKRLLRSPLWATRPQRRSDMPAILRQPRRVRAPRRRRAKPRYINGPPLPD